MYAMVIKHVISGNLGRYDYTRFQVHDKADLRYEEDYLGGVIIKIPPPPNLSTFFYMYLPSPLRMMKLVLVGFEVNDLNQRGKKTLCMMSLSMEPK